VSMQNDQQSVDLDSAVAAWLDEYKRIKAEIAALTERAEVARQHVEAALGDATLGYINGRPAVRWQTVTSTRFDTKKAKEILPLQVIELLQVTSEARRFDIVKDGE
jgi:predicted phage-related endonuclease